MTDNLSFKDLGKEFQIKFISQCIFDKDFGRSVISHVPPEIFDDNYMQMVFKSLYNFYKEYKRTPKIGELKQQLVLDYGSGNDSSSRINITQSLVDSIQESYSVEESEFIQKNSESIIKTIIMDRTLEKASLLLKKNPKNLDKVKNALSRVMSWGVQRHNSVDIFENVEEYVKDDYREAIPTGIEIIDSETNGGPSKGELFAILAPLGTGKTTMLTRIAANAMMMGRNVLHIFFEDRPVEIARKYYSCITRIPLSRISNNKKEIVDAIQRLRDKLEGKAFLHRFPSDNTTIEDVINLVKEYKYAKGINIDLLVIDYVDCIKYEKNVSDSLEDQKRVMRGLESLIYEENLLGWTAIQSNRSGVNAEVVETDQIGGSISKAQIAHALISLGRTREMKHAGVATLAFLKTRMAKDGAAYTNIPFDNNRLMIGTTTHVPIKFKENVEDTTLVTEKEKNYVDDSPLVAPKEAIVEEIIDENDFESWKKLTNSFNNSNLT